MRQHAIVVHGVIDAAVRNENVAFRFRNRVVGDDEPESLLVQDQTPRDVFRIAPGNCVVTAAVLDKAAVSGEPVQGLLESGSLPAASADLPRQAIEVRSALRLTADVLSISSWASIASL